MNRFFYKLSVDKPVARSNYGFQIVRSQDHPERSSSFDPDEYGWAQTSMGNEEDLNESKPQRNSRDKEEGPFPVETIADVRFRSERQTLRRLPRSGAIVFSIRVYQHPVVDIAQEPGVPGRMESAVKSWGEDIARCVIFIAFYLGTGPKHRPGTRVRGCMGRFCFRILRKSIRNKSERA